MGDAVWIIWVKGIFEFMNSSSNGFVDVKSETIANSILPSHEGWAFTMSAAFSFERTVAVIAYPL